MSKIELNIEIQVIINKVSDKFFRKHKDVYKDFIANIESFYSNKNTNIDIVAMKNYKNVFRMRIRSYRVIYSLENGKIIIIRVLFADSRGDVYKKFK